MSSTIPDSSTNCVLKKTPSGNGITQKFQRRQVPRAWKFLKSEIAGGCSVRTSFRNVRGSFGNEPHVVGREVKADFDCGGPKCKATLKIVCVKR